MRIIELLKRRIRSLIDINFFYKIYYKICAKFIVQVNRLVKKDSVSIGGGPDFHAIGWLNLEEVKSKINFHSFKLTPDCIFPLEDCSIKNVYTSHCLEHLDSDTVNRVLKESLRVLESGGRLLIKIPDFDRILNSWRNNDADMFRDELWDYGSVVYTWKNRNVVDCLDFRAAMLFCGFWNDVYGDHFSNKISRNINAYHGPAVVDKIVLRSIISQRSSPQGISKALREIVIKNEKNYHFNHCNAWSRSELEQLLVSTGFQVVTFDKPNILNEFKNFPGIMEMKDRSMYCWAKKI